MTAVLVLLVVALSVFCACQARRIVRDRAIYRQSVLRLSERLTKAEADAAGLADELRRWRAAYAELRDADRQTRRAWRCQRGARHG